MSTYKVYNETGITDYEKKLNTDDNKLKVGDILIFYSQNQQGYKKYEVIEKDDGTKELKVIGDEDSLRGGKSRKSRKSRKSKKSRKSHKSKKSKKSKKSHKSKKSRK